jgi:methylthioribose-1-phosphate isomerase
MLERIDRAVADYTAAVLPQSGSVMTSGDRAGVSAIIAAHRIGKHVHAYVCQLGSARSGKSAAARLAAEGVPATSIADAAAAVAMRVHNVLAVVVGAVSVAGNGDTESALGTYGLAILAAHHAVPLYVAVRRSAVDARLGMDDPTSIADSDVMPGHLIAAIVTEYGVSRPPYSESLVDLATRPSFAAIDRLERN